MNNSNKEECVTTHWEVFDRYRDAINKKESLKKDGYSVELIENEDHQWEVDAEKPLPERVRIL